MSGPVKGCTQGWGWDIQLCMVQTELTKATCLNPVRQFATPNNWAVQVSVAAQQTAVSCRLMEGIVDCEDNYHDGSVPLPPEDITLPADSIILNFDKVGCVRQQDRLQKAKLTLELLQRTICEVGQCHAVHRLLLHSTSWPDEKHMP